MGLDAARATAAVYVVVYHVVQGLHLPRLLAVPFSFGQEAVLVFFLLSGFVIYANERDRATRLLPYYLRRLRRIYPLLIVAMLVSTVLWAVGMNPASPSWATAVSTLLSVQDSSALKPGVVAPPYLGNDPLWSLSYEMFFYAVFPAVLLLSRRLGHRSIHIIGAVCCLAYVTYALFPNHLSLVVAYFLVWWVGAMAARAALSDGLIVRALGAELVWLGLLTVVALFVMVVVGFRGIGYYPGLMVRHFAVAEVMLLVLVSPVRRWLAATASFVGKPAVAVASISYGIYVLHYPIVIQTGSLHSAWILLALAVTVVLAIATERGLMRVIPRVRG